MMFEIGKKYRPKGTEAVYECEYVGTYRAFPSRSDWCLTPLLTSQNWEEYKEPVVHTKNLIWYKSSSGTVYCTTVYNANDLKGSNYTILSEQTVTYVENE